MELQHESCTQSRLSTFPLFPLLIITYVHTLYISLIIRIFCKHSALQVQVIEISSSGLSFKNVLHRQGSRVLCLAWNASGEYVAVGGIDSSVRIIHVSSASCIQRITLDEFSQKTTLLWDVKFLNKSSIVTASSLGRVQMWDFIHGTLQNTISQHSADVLTLTSETEENKGSTIFASGVDSMIMKISRVENKIGDTNGTHTRWVMTGKIRPHHHDVLSLHLSSTGMLASGGIEGELVITNTNHFTKSAYVKYQPFSGMARNFKMADNGNMFLFQDISAIYVWCISHASAGMKSECSKTYPHASPSPQLSVSSLTAPYCLLQLKAKPPHNILSSAISKDGSIIAISNAYEMWIYQFDALKRQLLLLANMLYSAITIMFKPNEPVIFFTSPLNGLQCATISTHGNVAVNTVVNDTCIRYIECSADGQTLAMLTKNWRIKLLDVASGTVIAKLPKLQSVPILFTFNTSKPQLVVFVGGKCCEVLIYHTIKNSLQSVGSLQRIEKSGHFEGRHPLSIFQVPLEKNLFCIYGNSSVMMFRLVADLEATAPSTHLPIQPVMTTSIVLFVGSFCHIHKGADNRIQRGLIIFEKSKEDILNLLPPTLCRKRYGT